MIKLLTLKTWMLIISVILFIAITGVTLFNYSQIDSYHSTRLNLYQLRTAILYANLAIRDAALAPTVELREQELYKMQGTRVMATKAFTSLSTARLTREEREVVRHLIKSRPEYRIAQNNYVQAIRERPIMGDDSEYHKQRWIAAKPYGLLMHHYIDTVDDLISTTHESSDYAKNKARETTLAILAVSICIVGFALLKIFR